MTVVFSSSITVAAATTNARALLIQSGITYTFDPAAGVTLDNYIDPNGAFEQRCILCKHASLPFFRAYYRPDVAGGREEWVFELGDPLTGTPVNMAAYSVEIHRTDGTVVTTPVPLHYWFARWRWQSAPRPVRTTAAALIAAGLLPHYDPTVLGRFNGNVGANTYSIMGFAGLSTAMGSGGESGDIGFITEWQANWVCNGALLSTVLAQGEATGTIQMFMRDPVTNGPLDLVNKYPQATMYDPSVGTPYIRHTTGLVAYDDGHDGAYAYLPALLTGDPYFIEALQFQSLFEVVGSPPNSRYTKNGRYFCWPLRNKLYAKKCTPTTVPSWMLPQSVFLAMMEKQRQHMINLMASPLPQYAVFHAQSFGAGQGTATHPDGTQAAPWQDEFVAGVFGLCVQLGHPEWRSSTVWALDSDVNRLNGTFWPRAKPVPYILQLSYSCNLAAPMDSSQTTMSVDHYGTAPWPATPFLVEVYSAGGALEKITVTDRTTSVWTVTRDPNPVRRVPHPLPNAVFGPFFTSWQQCAARAIAQYPDEIPFMPGDPTGMNVLYNIDSSSVTYPSHALCALAIALRNGINENGIQAAYDWLNGQFTTLLRSNWHPDWKWCIT